jgi:hypothetical protein
MTQVLEVVEVATTTDGQGFFTYTHDKTVDLVMATGNSPQSGASRLDDVTASVVGPRDVRVRCLNYQGLVANTNVIVTLLLVHTT